MKTMSLPILALAISMNAFAAADNSKANNKVGNKQDSAALGWLIMVNQSEIDAAKEAKNRKLNDDVLEYADLMIDAHSKNLDKTLELSKEIEIEPQKDKQTLDLEKKAQKGLSKLKDMDDKQFQKEYVNTMIKDHSSALKTLDASYMPKVKNDDLKKHFKDTRKHIAEHLDKAKALKTNKGNQE